MPNNDASLPEWADMQGLVLSSYPAFDRAAYLLLHIDDPEATRAWLRRIRRSVTPALRTRHDKSMQNLNLAFTFKALAKLLPAGTCPDIEFARPFVEGIAGDAHRCRILGDVGQNAPGTWAWGGCRQGQICDGCDKCVHIILMAYGFGEESLRSALEKWKPEEGLRCLHHIDATSIHQMGGQEHFGFADAVSQPILTGSRDAERFPESLHLTALGEIVLGYPNADGPAKVRNEDGADDPTKARKAGSADRPPKVPKAGGDENFGRNGSYLVVRQLRQEVEGFERFLDAQAGNDPLVKEHLAAKIVGRGRDGTPLVPYTSREDNEFGFADDPYGYGCPLGAHIRRANPRDSFVDTNAPSPTPLAMNRHRILRRGRTYGPPRSPSPGAATEMADYRSTTSATGSCLRPPADERGLMFLCLNADIERQFEFIQGDWINNTGFSGLSNERDPLIGYGENLAAGASATATRDARFTIQAVPTPAIVTDLKPFVTVRGAEYFFLPGLRALARLAGEPPDAAPEAKDPAVDELIDHLKDKLVKEYARPQIKRDAHPKMHGCVQGELTIGEVDEKFRHGIFEHPGTYRTWVRFSNAFGIQHDLKAQPRGLALKILDVPGPTSDFLSADDNEHSTQDFLMATFDAFFLASPDDYRQFAPAAEKGSLAVLWYFISRIRRWRGGIGLFKSSAVLARNPLAITYFSQTPYQLGPHKVKLQATPTLTPELKRSLPSAAVYKMKALAVGMTLSITRLRVIKLLAQLFGKNPTESSVTAACDRIASRDSLRHALMSFLSGHEAQFQLQVQCFVNQECTPIEDATKSWKWTESEFTPVATLRIPRQVFWPMPGMPKEIELATAKMMDLGENMSFTPWHGLKAHEPLGAINRARQRIYRQISQFRRHQNGVDADQVLANQAPKSYDELRLVVQGISVPETISRFDRPLPVSPTVPGLG